MNLIDRVIKPEIRELVRIQDSFNDRYDYLRLEKNERLLPFPPAALKEFLQSLNSEDLSGYFELGGVYERLAKYLDVQVSQLHLAAGSDLAIKAIYEACVGKGDNVVLHSPSYAMYRVYARLFGAEPRMIPVLPSWAADIDGMLANVDDRTRLVVLENPNGFVGTMPMPSDIEACAEVLARKNVLFLLDEAYYYVEHNECASRELIAKYPNVLLSQTLSKAHGLAGARVGYLVGNAELMEYVRRVRPMHEISSLSARATEWILTHPEFLDDFHASMHESKQLLRRELAALGIDVRDTHANFMLLYFPNDGRTRNMEARLRRRKVLIRRPFEEPALKGWSRVCVGGVDDSRRLLNALTATLEEGERS
jgi:histidinol-phosphate aminotransferase